MSSSADRPGRVHNRVGQPCPVCADTIRSVSYSGYTVAYCPTCQTGGKVLADNTTPQVPQVAVRRTTMRHPPRCGSARRMPTTARPPARSAMPSARPTCRSHTVSGCVVARSANGHAAEHDLLHVAAARAPRARSRGAAASSCKRGDRAVGRGLHQQACLATGVPSTPPRANGIGQHACKLAVGSSVGCGGVAGAWTTTALDGQCLREHEARLGEHREVLTHRRVVDPYRSGECPRP